METSHQIQLHSALDPTETRVDLNPTPLQSSGDAIRLDWHGMKMNDLVKLKDQALELSEEGNFSEAFPLFQESLDSLEGLMGAGHKITVLVLEAFVEIAAGEGSYGDVEQRLLKSMEAHISSLGMQEMKTLQSFVRLGMFYKDRSQLGEAEKLLIRAKTGFEALRSGDPERLFIDTKPISIALIDISLSLEDFDRTESEYSTLITWAEALGYQYGEEVRSLKHDISHFYSNNLSTGKVPRTKFEHILLQLIEFSKTQVNKTLWYHCAWEQLRSLYEENGDENALDHFIKDTENYLCSVRIVHARDRKVLFQIKRDLLLSLIRLRKYKAAEWVIHLQDAVSTDNNFGAESRMALDVQILHAQMLLAQGQWTDAEPLFLEAQTIAKKAVDDNDPITRSLRNV